MGREGERSSTAGWLAGRAAREPWGGGAKGVDYRSVHTHACTASREEREEYCLPEEVSEILWLLVI